MNGIIYKYTSPSGKVYIGQTIDETRRKSDFLNLKKSYSGKRIDFARKKYGPEKFEYEVLESKEYDNIDEALYDLNLLESYYIGKYDSFNNGYNMTYGGDGVKGLIFTDEVRLKISETLKNHYKTHSNPFKGQKHSEKTKEKMSKIAKTRECSPFKGKKMTETAKQLLSEHAKQRTGDKNPFWGKTHTENTKKAISEANSIAVVQIDAKTDEVIKTFKSAKEAGESLGKPRSNSEIIKVCKNYISPSGRKYITALGYKWKYEKDIKGSTTIETASTDETE